MGYYFDHHLSWSHIDNAVNNEKRQSISRICSPYVSPDIMNIAISLQVLTELLYCCVVGSAPKNDIHSCRQSKIGIARLPQHCKYLIT